MEKFTKENIMKIMDGFWDDDNSEVPENQDLDMENENAFWIEPNGIIHLVKLNHIDFMYNNLELFKITLDDYKNEFKKLDEKIGWEGKARKQLIQNALKNGWIRIRNYNNQGWSIEAWEMSKPIFDNIQLWANKMRSYTTIYGHTIINIHILSLETTENGESNWLINTTFDGIDALIPGK